MYFFWENNNYVSYYLHINLYLKANSVQSAVHANIKQKKTKSVFQSQLMPLCEQNVYLIKHILYYIFYNVVK